MSKRRALNLHHVRNRWRWHDASTPNRGAPVSLQADTIQAKLEARQADQDSTDVFISRTLAALANCHLIDNLSLHGRSK